MTQARSTLPAGGHARAGRSAVLALLVAALFLPAASGSEVHDQNTSTASFEYLGVDPTFPGDGVVGQQVMTAPYVVESTPLDAILKTVQVRMSRTTAATGGSVCVTLRPPGITQNGWYQFPSCRPVTDVPTTAGLVDFQFQTGASGLHLGSGESKVDFWVSYEGASCANCVKVYRSTSDVYRPNQAAGIRQYGYDGVAPEGLWVYPWDLSFALKVDHTPVIKTLTNSPAPTVTPSGVTTTLRGQNVDDSGAGASVTMWYGLYPQGTGPELNVDCTTTAAPGATCSAPVTGLYQHQTYYVQACGMDDIYVGYQCGVYLTFSTPNQAPTAITDFVAPQWGMPNAAVTFTGTSTDPLENLRYEIDTNGNGVRDAWSGNDFPSGTTGSVSYSFPAAGTYSVRIRACDEAPPSGTCTAWTTAQSVLIDGTPPSEPNLVSTTGHVSGVWSSNNDPGFSWTEADTGGSGIQGSYRGFDGIGYVGIAPHTSAAYTNLPDGDHLFKLYVYDKAGNSAYRTFSTRIDTLPPSVAAPHVSSGTLGSNGWYTSDVQMDVASADAGIGVQCERYSTSASGPWLPTDDLGSDACAGMAAWAFPGEGQLTYYGAAKDGTNKTRAGADSLTVKVDKTAPTGVAAVLAGTAGDNGWYTSDVSASIAGSDAVSGVTCEQHRLHGTAAWFPVQCAPDDSWTQTAEGSLDYDIHSINGAGLATEVPVTVKVDKTPPGNAMPVISGTLGSNNWYTSTLTFTINGTDAVSGVRCEQHAPGSTGPWTPADVNNCPANDSWTHSTEGSFTYWGRATDQAGWSRAVDSVSFKLDKTPPTITDAQADKTWTNVNPLLNVDFGDARSGIAKIEYAIWTGPGQTGSNTKAWTQFFSTTADGTLSYTTDWQVSGLAQGNNYVTARVTDRAGLSTTANDVVLIQWDTQPPSRANPVVVSGTLGDNSWYTTDVGLAVDSSDATAGVASEWHSLVPGQWQGGTPADVWTDATEGTDGWYGRAVDLATNEAQSAVVPVKIDKTNPVAALSLQGTAGNAGWYRSNVDATINLQDAASGPALIGTKIDSAAWATVAAQSLATIAVTGDGTHSFSYYGKDFAGRTDATQTTPHIQNIKIDRTNPTSSHILVGTLGTNGWYTSAVEARLSGADATSGFARLYYQADGGSWTSTTSATPSVNFTTAGTHVLSYYAEDQAGNTDGSQGAPKSVTIKIDLAAPASTRTLVGTLGTNGWYTTPVDVTLTATDATGGSGVKEIQYGLDSGTTTGSVYGGTVQVATEGTHTFAYRAVDMAGRTEAVRSTTLNVDTQPPQLAGWTQTPANVDGSQSAPVTVDVTATGGASQLYTIKGRYSYNGGATWSLWTSLGWLGGNTFELSIPAPGAGWWLAKDQTLSYEVEAVDNAGNRVTEGQTDLVDRLPPSLALLSPGAWEVYVGSGIHPIQFRASDADHDTVAYTVRLSSDGGATYPTTLYATSANEDGATHTYTYNWDTTGLNGNNYALKVEANDGAFPVSVVRTPLVLDTTAPHAQIVKPGANQIVLPGGTTVKDPTGSGDPRIVAMNTTIEATADDGAGSGVAYVEFRVDGQLLGTDSTKDSAGNYGILWSSGTSLGSHRLTAQSFDRAGNPSLPYDRWVTIVEEYVAPGSLPAGSA